MDEHGQPDAPSLPRMRAQDYSKDDPPDVRKPKHWQMFHVAARKR